MILYVVQSQKNDTKSVYHIFLIYYHDWTNPGSHIPLNYPWLLHVPGNVYIWLNSSCDLAATPLLAFSSFPTVVLHFSGDIIYSSSISPNRLRSHFLCSAYLTRLMVLNSRALNTSFPFLYMFDWLVNIIGTIFSPPLLAQNRLLPSLHAFISQHWYLKNVYLRIFFSSPTYFSQTLSF